MSDENKNIGNNQEENQNREEYNKKWWKNVGLKPNLKLQINYKKIILFLFGFLCICFSVISLFNLLSNYYVNKGNFHSAYNIQKRLYSITNKFVLNYTVIPLYFLNNIANIDFSSGNINESLQTKNLINIRLQKHKYFKKSLYYNNTLDIAYINFLLGKYQKAKILFDEMVGLNEIRNYNTYGKIMNLYLLMGYEEVAYKYYINLEESTPQNYYDLYAKNINLFQYNLTKNDIYKCESYKKQLENFLKTEPMAITKIRIYLNLAEYYAKINNLIECKKYITKAQNYISEKNSYILNTQIILSIAKIISIYDKNEAITILLEYENESEISQKCTKYYINRLSNKTQQENAICLNLIKIGVNN